MKSQEDELEDIQGLLTFFPKSSIKTLLTDIDLSLRSLPGIPSRGQKGLGRNPEKRKATSAWNNSHKLNAARELIVAKRKLQILLIGNFASDDKIALTHEEQNLVYVARIAVFNTLHPWWTRERYDTRCKQMIYSNACTPLCVDLPYPKAKLLKQNINHLGYADERMVEIVTFALNGGGTRFGKNGITFSLVCNAIMNKTKFVSTDPNFFGNLHLRLYLLGLIPFPGR